VLRLAGVGVGEPGGELAGAEVEHDVAEALSAERVEALFERGALVVGERASEATLELSRQHVESACPLGADRFGRECAGGAPTGAKHAVAGDVRSVSMGTSRSTTEVTFR